jgi:hypothetical protein
MPVRENTLLKYGLPQGLVDKLVSMDLSASTIKVTSTNNTKLRYSLDDIEANLAKSYLKGKPIDEDILNTLLLTIIFLVAVVLVVKASL